MSLNFLYLNDKDMVDADVLNMPKCISSMEDVFKLLFKGDYRMGGEGANDHGIRVSFPKESSIADMPLNAPDYRFGAMPAYLGGRFHIFGTKVYGSNPQNKKEGLPRSILMMSLLDVNSGAPIAYMSANKLSGMRTAAVAGVGAKYLCSSNPSTLGIIGPGAISLKTLDAILCVQPSITTLKIVGCRKEDFDWFYERLDESIKALHIINCMTIEEACENSDIIFFGNSNAAKFEDNPYIERDWLKPGALLISASALRLSNDLYSNNNVKFVTDNYKMYEDWGKGSIIPTQKSVSTLLGMGLFDAVSMGLLTRDRIIDIGELITCNQVIRDSKEQIVVYALGGMPIEDVAWAYDCYCNAINNDIGTVLNLWD